MLFTIAQKTKIFIIIFFNDISSFILQNEHYLNKITSLSLFLEIYSSFFCVFYYIKKVNTWLWQKYYTCSYLFYY